MKFLILIMVSLVSMSSLYGATTESTRKGFPWHIEEDLIEDFDHVSFAIHRDFSAFAQ